MTTLGYKYTAEQKEKRTRCPVCKIIYWDRAIKIHIINAAKGETYKKMNDVLNYYTHDFTNLSRGVLIKNMPHLAFYRRHLRNKKVFTI